MPACDARYDVILSDGYSGWNGGRPSTTAVLDFMEDREPDDWGEPGPLLKAILERYWSSNGKRITYGPIGIRNRMILWVDGGPTRAQSKNRRYLRWRWVEPDPGPQDDPDWVLPP